MHTPLVDHQVVLVLIKPRILQDQQLELLVEVLIVFHHQLDGEILVEIMRLEVLVQVVVALVQQVVLQVLVMRDLAVLD
jgi:hypothetical protein|tara:strand:- start:1136 stop:1372 length:237 start_codon:yes stop_codon:yes gene_type:complete